MEVGLVVAGKYRLREQIGVGAMGAVWAAVHEALDRPVAIKFLTPSQEDRVTAAARFVREAKSVARVKHRFVVDVFDFGVTDDGFYYMVLELLEGQELATCLRREEPWRVRDAIQFAMQCLSGLDAVHKSGLVHRDLKPENIYVVRDNDGRFPKLLDFGISKIAEEETPATATAAPSTGPGRRPRLRQLTRVGITLGTPCYMSPEQLRGRRDLDGRADLYAMGVLLYQWVTGHVPYNHDNLAELAQLVASRSASTVSHLRPELGSQLSQAIMRALAPERDSRFQDAQEMRSALADALESIPPTAKCLKAGVRRPAAPVKTQLVMSPLRSPLAEHIATLKRITPRFMRNIPVWAWAVATLALLGAVGFVVLRGPANAETGRGATLVIGGSGAGESPPGERHENAAVPAILPPEVEEQEQPAPLSPKQPAKQTAPKSKPRK